MIRQGNWFQRERLTTVEKDEKGNHKYVVIGAKKDIEKQSKKLKGGIIHDNQN
jgi:hypothetical protein